jgi:hypothetical protein
MLQVEINKKNEIIPGINYLPEGMTLIKKGKGYVEAKRADGLHVFFDLDNDPISALLNQVRAEGNDRQVITAVGLVRGLQIRHNYAEKYAAHLLPEVEQEMITLAEDRLLSKCRKV